MSHIVSFDFKQPYVPPPVCEPMVPLPILKKDKSTGKKRGRKPRVYTMTKVEGEFIVDFI